MYHTSEGTSNVLHPRQEVFCRFRVGRWQSLLRGSACSDFGACQPLSEAAHAFKCLPGFDLAEQCSFSGFTVQLGLVSRVQRFACVRAQVVDLEKIWSIARLFCERLLVMCQESLKPQIPDRSRLLRELQVTPKHWNHQKLGDLLSLQNP